MLIFKKADPMKCIIDTIGKMGDICGYLSCSSTRD